MANKMKLTESNFWCVCGGKCIINLAAVCRGSCPFIVWVVFRHVVSGFVVMW